MPKMGKELLQMGLLVNSKLNISGRDEYLFYIKLRS
jgi:hypothetical protein